MKANTRIIVALALVVSLLGWVAVPSSHAQKAKKLPNADKADKQAQRESKKADREAKKEARQEERAAKKEERAAKKEERQATKGENGDRAARKEEREAKKEEREAKREERQAKRNEKQGAQGNATQPAEAGVDGGAAARKSRRANAAGPPDADKLGEGNDPFEKQGGRRNKKAAATATTTTGEASPDGQASQQPAAKGRKAKAAAATAAGTDSATTSPAAVGSTQSAVAPAQTPVNASPAAIKSSVPASSTGAAAASAPSSSTGASVVSGDVPSATTSGEQSEAEPAAATGAGSSKGNADQKFMKAAKHDLTMAVSALKRATADKGTHRDRALELTQQAVAEIDKGMAYDNRNPNDRPKERPGKQRSSVQSPWGDGVVESSPAFGMQIVAASWTVQKTSEQPNMKIAMQHMQSALSNLDKASADKGGFRVNAARLVREAIKEVEQGIAYDNQH